VFIVKEKETLSFYMLGLFSLYVFRDAESLGKCQRLLDRGISPYAQLLATTTITKLVSRATQILTLQQRIDIRSGHTFYLNYRRA
jgi:hypothetical protein